MTLKLTEEQRLALKAGPAPIYVEDDQTRQRYVLVSENDYRRLLDEEFRRELQIAFDQADTGEEEEWDVEAAIAEAKRRFGRKTG